MPEKSLDKLYHWSSDINQLEKKQLQFYPSDNKPTYKNSIIQANIDYS